MMLRARKDSADAAPYAALVANSVIEETDESPTAFGRAVQIIMRWRGWNQSELGRRCGVSQRHISDIVRGRTDVTTEIVEKVAAAAGLKPWQLFMDNLNEELLTNTDLQIVVETYVHHPHGRKLISGAAEMVLRTPKS